MKVKQLIMNGTTFDRISNENMCGAMNALSR